MEEELNVSQMALAMSQIQPHFIYNSLNSIYHLCDKDIETAQQTISDFSDYLQRILSAVSCTTLISFEEELKHVKTYLKLEQIRFGKDLHVEYHIEASGCNVQGSNRKGTHVGIRNVRHRLDILCHGTLEVKSEPGKGTTSTICIPKEKET